MKNNDGFAILFILILVFIAMFVAGLVYTFITQGSGNGVITEYIKEATPTKSEEADNLSNKGYNRTSLNDLPPLYSGVSWIGPERVGREDGDYLIYFNSEGIYLGGERWTATLGKDEFSSQRAGFETYYDNEVVRRGWSSDEITIDRFNIDPMAADGPISSSWGYAASDGSYVREIILTWVDFQEEDRYELEIFVSEIIDTKEISLSD